MSDKDKKSANADIWYDDTPEPREPGDSTHKTERDLVEDAEAAADRMFARSARPSDEIAQQFMPDPTPPPGPQTRRRELKQSTLHGQVEEEPFLRPGAMRMGILGGKDTGKTYLFQAMVYRAQSPTAAGALTPFIKDGSSELFHAVGSEMDRVSESGLHYLDQLAGNAIPINTFLAGLDSARSERMNLEEFCREFCNWEKIGTTQWTKQLWYKLRLEYSCGVLGRDRGVMDLEFLDASGDGLGAELSARTTPLWEAYVDCAVAVFCLPIWAAFPDMDKMAEHDMDERELALSQLQNVLNNFRTIREKHKARHPVRTILVLTMADDNRSALRAVREHWIKPFVDQDSHWLHRVKTFRGMVQYLESTRRLSRALLELFGKAPPLISNIPNKMLLGAGDPWIIPISAIHGETHAKINEKDSTVDRRKLPPPIPAHVEVPLLVALCSKYNALM